MREPPGSLGVRGTCVVVWVMLALFGGLIPPNLACPYDLTPFGMQCVLALFVASCAILAVGAVMRSNGMSLAAVGFALVGAGLNWAAVMGPFQPEPGLFFDSSAMYLRRQEARLECERLKQEEAALKRQLTLDEATLRPARCDILSPSHVLIRKHAEGGLLVDFTRRSVIDIASPHLRRDSAVVLDSTAGALYFIGDVTREFWFTALHPSGIYRYDLATGTCERVVAFETNTRYLNAENLLVKRDGRLFYYWGTEEDLHEHPVGGPSREVPGFGWKSGLLDDGDQLILAGGSGLVGAADVIDLVRQLDITIYAVGGGRAKTTRFDLAALGWNDVGHVQILKRDGDKVELVLRVARLVPPSNVEAWLVEADLAEATLRTVRRLPSPFLAYFDDRTGVELRRDGGLWHYDLASGNERQLVPWVGNVTVLEREGLILCFDEALRRFDLRTGEELNRSP